MGARRGGHKGRPYGTEIRSRDASASEFCFYASRKPFHSASPKRREAERRTAHPTGPHRRQVYAVCANDLLTRRAPFLRPPTFAEEDRDPWDPLERARSPFGAPPRHSPRFYPRLGPSRASWNHRMQTGGPSPAPVQRAPRGPVTRRTGRCPSRPRAKVTSPGRGNRTRSVSRIVSRNALRERDSPSYN